MNLGTYLLFNIKMYWMIRNIYAHMQKEIRKGANTFSLHCLSPCENFGSITKLFFIYFNYKNHPYSI